MITKSQPKVDNAPQEYLLDLFSTSHKASPKCHKNAPLICIPPKDGKPAYLYQGCCNDWLCPRCGEIRAREEYGRIVNGCQQLSQTETLYFVTFTCRGDVSLEESLENYLLWSDRLLTAMRNHARASEQNWYYVQVTEPQKRKHPHSHLIMTFAPKDVFSPLDDYDGYLDLISRVNAKIPLKMRFSPTAKKDLVHTDLVSEWLMLAAVRAGLGVQCRISVVDIAEAVARYVAKYLFKVAMTAKWAKGWKRIRYSNSFPKMPDMTNHNAFPVLSKQDWSRVARIEGDIVTSDYIVYVMGMVRHVWNMRYIPPEEAKINPRNGNHS